MRILVVEQDGTFTTALRSSLFAQDLEINSCDRPPSAIEMIAKDQPDIVLVDTASCYALPGFFSRLKELYTEPGTGDYYPVVIGIIPRQIDASNETIYLDLGFDLVFQKPVENRLFFSRLSALDRRIGIGKNRLTSRHLLINTATQDCHIKTMYGEIITHFKVSPFQFSILKLLLQTPRGIWSRDQLAQEVDKSYSEIGDRAIDKAVCHLRRVLRTAIAGEEKSFSLQAGYKFPFIQTQEGAGYYFFDAVALPSDTYLVSTGSVLQDNHYRRERAVFPDRNAQSA